MKAEKIKATFTNLQTHMGSLRDSKFKMMCGVTYEDLLLVMDGGKRVARLHARNINNVYLEKKAIRISALNFEINDDGDVSVASGFIRLEVGNDAEAWYKELWG